MTIVRKGPLLTGFFVALLLVTMLSGCASDRFLVPPQFTSVHFTVTWGTEEDVIRACRDPKAFACITRLPTAADPRAELTLRMAKSWDDWPAICSAGHEFYHGLGALHRRGSYEGSIVLP